MMVAVGRDVHCYNCTTALYYGMLGYPQSLKSRLKFIFCWGFFSGGKLSILLPFVVHIKKHSYIFYWSFTSHLELKSSPTALRL